MPRLHPLNPEQATSTAKTVLGGIIERHGNAGPMVRTMAHSPALLQGYLDPKGNNFWGVETFVRNGQTIILGSDRDSGLWVFRRTG